VVDVLRNSPTRGDGYYVADAQGGTRVVDEEVGVTVEVLGFALVDSLIGG
jgi:hypothetical protein